MNFSHKLFYLSAAFCITSATLASDTSQSTTENKTERDSLSTQSTRSSSSTQRAALLETIANNPTAEVISQKEKYISDSEVSTGWSHMCVFKDCNGYQIVSSIKTTREVSRKKRSRFIFKCTALETAFDLTSDTSTDVVYKDLDALLIHKALARLSAKNSTKVARGYEQKK